MEISDIKLENCRICPVECGADRRVAAGACGAGKEVEISSWNLHFGEEPVISGQKGSGTIFFAHCSLKCIFCQNYPISHLGHGRKITLNELSGLMLNLQEEGAHNINLVTPTHYGEQIKTVLENLRPEKLKIPVVYNCSGYEKKETLKELDGLIDIYMPDAKFSSKKLSSKLSSVSDYPQINRAALKEMYRQVGAVKIGSDGLMKKGLLIRHLVLPGFMENSKKILEFLSGEFNSNIYLSLMAQYHPAYRSFEVSSLSRRLTPGEYRSIVKFTERLNFKKGYFQDL